MERKHKIPLWKFSPGTQGYQRYIVLDLTRHDPCIKIPQKPCIYAFLRPPLLLEFGCKNVFIHSLHQSHSMTNL